MKERIEYMGSEYMNRELSWLKFNERVLEEAEDKSVPLCERFTFVSIYQTNLDEFFYGPGWFPVRPDAAASGYQGQ